MAIRSGFSYCSKPAGRLLFNDNYFSPWGRIIVTVHSPQLVREGLDVVDEYLGARKVLAWLAPANRLLVRRPSRWCSSFSPTGT